MPIYAYGALTPPVERPRSDFRGGARFRGEEMWISLQLHGTAEGVKWQLSSIRPAANIRSGLYYWQRSGLLECSPSDYPDARSAIAAALRDVLARLGEREGLD